MIGAKWFDPMVGVDIHFVFVPTPAGPIPTPLPHPFVGVVFDPAGLIVGAAISAAASVVLGTPFTGPVLTNMMPAANTGTEGTNKMVMPHFPMPPGTAWAPVPVGPKPTIPGKPPAPPVPSPVPSNDAVLITGSKTVYISGTNACRLGDLAMSCGEPLRLPSSTCLAIPMGPPVLIGGPPALDFMAALMGMIKTQWVSGKLHALFKAKPGSWRSKIICFFTGHPVDVASGMVVTDSVDFKLPGPIPFKFERTYYSRSDYSGPLGHGWHHSYDQFLRAEDKRIVYRADDGRDIYFRIVDDGKSTRNQHERVALTRKGDTYRVETAGRSRLYFGPAGRADGTLPLQFIDDLNGNRITLKYDTVGRLIQLIDSGGREINFRNDRDGRLIALDAPHPDGKGQRVEVTRFQYDENGDLVAAFDALGHPYRYAYKHHLLVQETNRNGLSFYFAYDGVDQDAWCVRTWGDGGIYDHVIIYDKEKHLTIVENSLGQKTVYYWNHAGLVEKKVDALGCETTYEYDESFRKVAQTNPNGGVTSWHYDEWGSLAGITDAAGRKSEMVRDDWGNPVQLRFPDGSVVENTFDDRGNLLTRTDPAGGRWSYGYSPRGLLSEAVNPLNARDRFAYSERGDLIEWTDDSGATRRYRYSMHGRVAEVTGTTGGKTEIEYDLCGRVVMMRFADETRMRWRYDPEGNVIERVDRAGFLSQFRYGGWNQVIERIERSGHHLYYEYDTEGRLTRLVNQRGDDLKLGRNAVGRICEQVEFDGIRRRYIYDPAGNLTALEEHPYVEDDTVPPGDARVIEFQRDPTGRVLQKVFPSGDSCQFDYDEVGQLIEARTPTHTIKRTYDVNGNLTEELQDNETVRYEYDITGRMRRRLSPNDCRIEYDYDSSGRLLGVVVIPSGGAPREIKFKRDPGGQIIEHAVPGDVRTMIERDANGRIIEMVNRRHGEVTRRRYHEYTNGHLMALEDSQDGRIDFRYDPVGQLTQVLRAGEVIESFDFDPAGNITRAGQDEYRVGKGNRLLSIGGDAIECDGFGNTIRRKHPQTESVQRLEYNDRNQLVRVIDESSGDIVEFEYDVLGRRVTKRVGDSVVRFVWDGSRLLGEKDSEGFREYVFDDFAPLAQVSGATVRYYHNDHLGTPLALTDDNGETVWSGVYEAYGALRSETPGVHQPFRFPGQYADRETGLCYNLFRYYDPVLKRFVQPDPIGLYGGMNYYQYCANPILWKDPMGLSPSCGELPEGSQVIEQSEHYVIYRTADGAERIRFLASEARTLKAANPGRNYTTDSLAGLNDDGHVFVHEGRHRAIGAAHGDTIAPDAGGVPDAPGWLDYEHSGSRTSETGVPVRDLDIDYTQPDLSVDDADAEWNRRWGG